MKATVKFWDLNLNPITLFETLEVIKHKKISPEAKKRYNKKYRSKK